MALCILLEIWMLNNYFFWFQFIDACAVMNILEIEQKDKINFKKKKKSSHISLSVTISIQICIFGSFREINFMSTIKSKSKFDLNGNQYSIHSITFRLIFCFCFWIFIPAARGWKRCIQKQEIAFEICKNGHIQIKEMVKALFSKIFK